jgi:hypothetical protein
MSHQAEIATRPKKRERRSLRAETQATEKA